MRGPEQLLQNEKCRVSAMGAWFPEEGRVVIRDKDLFREFKELPWMALLLYVITGRHHNARQVRLFEGIWTLCTSYPDPRLWNNRVAALAGTVRSTPALGMGAAIAVSEASIYGGRPEIRALDMLFRVQRQLDEGTDLAEFLRSELTRHRVLPGYGRPIRTTDERIEPLLALAESLGFSSGPYVTLAFRIEDSLIKGHFRLRMNIAALAAALAADQGMSAREYYHYAVLAFSAGLLACYIDACDHSEGTLFPLTCNRLEYSGHPPRSWRDGDAKQSKTPQGTEHH